MLAASSPPASRWRSQSEDEWSLITANLQEEPCSPGLLGDDQGSRTSEGSRAIQVTPSQASFDGAKKNNFFGRLSIPERLSRLAAETTGRQASACWQTDAPMPSLPSSSSSRGPNLRDFSASIEAELASPSVTFAQSDSGAVPAYDEDTPPEDASDPQEVWNQTEQLARDIRQANIGVPEVKAPSVDRYMKIVVAGQPGLGKTTFVNNIRQSFGQLDNNDLSHPSMTTAFSGTLHTVKREDDKGNKFHYFLQDTKGFCTMEEAAPLLDSIKMQSESYFKTEQDGKRCQPMAQLVDPRVDVCLYFLPPHTIYPLDVEAIGRISQLVPVIPVMAKADTMTPEELEAYRAEAARALSASGVTIHKFKDDDAAAAGFTSGEHIFAVVGSTSIDMSVSRSWPIRSYPWGRVEALNRAHSDVPALKNLVFALSYEDFKEDTEKRYLAYRKARLEGNSVPVAHKASRKLPREPAFQAPKRNSKKSMNKALQLLTMTAAAVLTVFLCVGFENAVGYLLTPKVQPPVQSGPPAWFNEHVLQLPTREGAGPLSEGVLLTSEEYNVTMNLLLQFFHPHTRRLTKQERVDLVRSVESVMKGLMDAKADGTRYQVPPPAPEVPECPAAVEPECPAAPSVPPPSKTPGPSIAKNLLNNLVPISSKIGREVTSSLSSVSSGLSSVGREVSSGLSGLSSMSVDIGKGLSSVTHDVSQGLSSFNRDAQSSLKALTPHITSGLSSVRDMSANALDWAQRGARSEVDRLLEHAPSVDAVKSSVSDSARAASSWVQRKTRETSMWDFLVPQKNLANETAIVDVSRIFRRISMILAFM